MTALAREEGGGAIAMLYEAYNEGDAHVYHRAGAGDTVGLTLISRCATAAMATPTWRSGCSRSACTSPSSEQEVACRRIEIYTVWHVHVAWSKYKWTGW